MYRVYICLVLSLSVFVVHGFGTCGTPYGTITNVTVTNCSPPKNCILRRGTDATIGISFKINKEVQKVSSIVHGVIGGADIPFPLSQPNGCLKSGLTCPLQKSDEAYSYTATLSVKPFYPKIRVTVKWELRDESGNDIVCVLIPSEIK